MGSRSDTSGRSTRRRDLLARIGLLLLPALVVPGYDAAPHVEAVAALRDAPQVAELTWLRVDTRHPDTLYVGGYLRHDFPCPEIGGFPCPTWSARSVDGGATWRSMDGALQGRGAGSRLPPFKPCIYPRSFIYPADTGYVYATITVHCSPAGSFSSVLRSRDRGLRWQALFSAHGGVDPSYDNLAISPVAASRVYAVTVDDGPSGGSYNARLRVTDDAGAHWRIAPGDMTITQPGGFNGLAGAVLGDPRHRDTVYSGLNPLPVDDGTPPTLWSRSEDAGRTWSPVPPPPGGGGQAGFVLDTDTHLPGLLVARVPARPTRSRRWYVSSDSGRTWRAATCPGVLHDGCPSSVVDSVFGSGSSYGFYPDGIHAFTGDGPAGARMAVSDRLPATPGAIVSAQSGDRTGDPVYVLVRAIARLQLFRGDDGGRAWRRITPPDSLEPDRGI